MSDRGWLCYFCKALLTGREGQQFDIVSVKGNTRIVCKDGCKEVDDGNARV